MQSSTSQSDRSESDSKYVFIASRNALEVHADTGSRHRFQPLTVAFSSAFAVQAFKVGL